MSTAAPPRRSRDGAQTQARPLPVAMMVLLVLLVILVCVIAVTFLGSRAATTFHGVGNRLADDDAILASPQSAAPGDAEIAGTDAALRNLKPGEAAGNSGDALPRQPALPRKIIYTAELSLIVKDFSVAEAALRALIAKYEGQIAQSDLGATTGQQRTGRWKVRIPVAHYESFLKEASGIGEPERNKVDSQDVTEEYYDVEARIRNKKVEEERLVQHLKDTTGKLSEILEVERELSRVRGEIERLQGRLQLLANLTTLTTITVSMREIKDYVPPTAPTYGTKLSRAFYNSWEGLVNFGQAALLVGVALVPWLPLILLVFVALVWVWRAQRRRQVLVEAAPGEGSASPG
jgi:hypothetical protein